MPQAHPEELSHEESVQFLRQLPEFGDPMPHLILTGGDPLARADLFELIAEARRLGIGLSITPAASHRLSREVLERLRDAGVEGLGLSLDGSTPALHDGIRGVPGTFDLTLRAMDWARELAMPVQVNTLASRETAADLPAVYELLRPYGIARWSLFFLISTGRGKVLDPLSAEEAEKLMAWIHETSHHAPFTVATTEAPSYRRVVLERMKADGLHGTDIKSASAYRGFGIRDGHGIVFVSNTGDICPAGFLPVAAGNVRRDRLAFVYRESKLFRALHDPSQFDGRCGVCEYRALCGGSRARAFSETGDPLASDPLCEHQPKASRG